MEHGMNFTTMQKYDDYIYLTFMYLDITRTYIRLFDKQLSFLLLIINYEKKGA